MNKTMVLIGILFVLVGVAGILGVAFYGSELYVSETISTPVTTTQTNAGVTTGNSTVYTNLMRNLMTDFSKATYASPGEQIYLSGTDQAGASLTATFVGTGMPMQGMMNRRLSCANCHGETGRGDFLFPDGTTKSADIRFSVLTEEGYDQASFNKAVTQGVDDKGNALSDWMPRWKIGEQDLADLAAHLKTL